MLRLVVVLILFMAAAAGGISYLTAGAAQSLRFLDAASSVGRAFTIPTSQAAANPANAALYLDLIAEAARQARVNVFRTAVGFDRSGHAVIDQYLYLTSPSPEFFSHFPLVRGEWLTPSETREGRDFVSTTFGRRPGQVGWIAELVGLPRTSLRPLREAASRQFAAGTYYVEASSPGQARAFLARLTEEIRTSPRLRADGVAGSRPPTLVANPGLPAHFGDPDGSILPFIWFAVIGLSILVVVTVLFACLAQSKGIGVRRLHGDGPVRIWWEVTGRLMAGAFAVGMVGVALVADALGRWSGVLVGRAVVTGLVVDAVAMLASAVAVAYAIRLPVNQALKGRRPLGVPLTLDVGAKIGVLAAAVLLSLGPWAKAALVGQKLRDLRIESTEATPFSHYGYFRNRVGLQLLDYAEQARPSNLYVEERWLYPYLDRRGLVFVDAADFDPGTSGRGRILTVNRNYLRAFPLWSPSGHHRIQVGETASPVVLVPERDRARESSLVREALQGWCLPGRDGFCAPWRPGTGSPPAKVLVYRDQAVPTLDPDLSPTHNYRVESPAIAVMTRRNTSLGERTAVVGGLGSAWKIPIHGGVAATYAAILPELRKLDLARDLTALTTVRGAERARVMGLRAAFFKRIASAVAFLALGVLLAGASITRIFVRFRRRFLVRRLHGESLLSAYREWAVLLVGTVLAEFVLCALYVYSRNPPPLAQRPSNGTDLVRVFVVWALVTVVEIGASLVFMRRRERAALSVALKEEW